MHRWLDKRRKLRHLDTSPLSEEEKASRINPTDTILKTQILERFDLAMLSQTHNIAALSKMKESGITMEKLIEMQFGECETWGVNAAQYLVIKRLKLEYEKEKQKQATISAEEGNPVPIESNRNEPTLDALRQLSQKGISKLFLHSSKPAPLKPWRPDMITRYFKTYHWLDPVYLFTRVPFLWPLIAIYRGVKKGVRKLWSSIKKASDPPPVKSKDNVAKCIPASYKELSRDIRNILGLIGYRDLSNQFLVAGYVKRYEFLNIDSAALQTMTLTNMEQEIVSELIKQCNLLRAKQDIVDNLVCRIIEVSKKRLYEDMTVPFRKGESLENAINRTVDLVYMDFVVAQYTGCYEFLPALHIFEFQWSKKYHQSDPNYCNDIEPHLPAIKQTVANSVNATSPLMIFIRCYSGILFKLVRKILQWLYEELSSA